MVSAIAADDTAYLRALVRERDRPRYYATLFAPAEIRDDLFALYGFAAEIARIPELVSEPPLGEIRLRWWSDALAEVSGRAGEGETPALRAVSAAIAKHRLPQSAFEALVEARSADLYSNPPASIGELEGRLGETESALFQLAAIVTGPAGPEVADAAGHAGVAYGIARRLSALAFDRARGRTIIPADILLSSGMSSTDFFAPKLHAGLPGAVTATVAVARGHLAEARRHVSILPVLVRAAFLPLAVVAPLLRRIENLGTEIGLREAQLSDIESLIRIGFARLR